MSALPGMRERTILMGGFSKAYAMTGWRVGYVAAPAGDPRGHRQGPPVRDHVGPDDRPGRGARGGPRGRGRRRAGCCAEYDRRRRLLVDGLNALGLETFEPRGAFYAFPRIGSTGLDDETFAERLLTEERVAVVPGSAFGPSGAGHVRMCYATSYEQLEEALRADRAVRRATARRRDRRDAARRRRPVAIDEIGRGTPVLFLHGFGIDHRSLLHDRRTRVRAPSGLSAPPRRPAGLRGEPGGSVASTAATP